MEVFYATDFIHPFCSREQKLTEFYTRLFWLVQAVLNSWWLRHNSRKRASKSGLFLIEFSCDFRYFSSTYILTL